MRCANPKCGAEFHPAVKWQRYCSKRCGDLVRHRRAHGRIGPRKPSRRYFRMFLSLIRQSELIGKMKEVDES